jgi:hypothetical protein
MLLKKMRIQGVPTIWARSRLANQDNVNVKMDESAMHQANSGDHQANSHNSFSILDSDDIYIRALEMGEYSSSFTLKHIYCMEDLEMARHNLDKKQKIGVEEDIERLDQIFLLAFGNDGALVKDHIYNPLCDIVSRPRDRRKIQNINDRCHFKLRCRK